MINNIYLVTRTDNVGYDEYDSCVIIARDIEDLNRIVKESSNYDKEYKGLNIHGNEMRYYDLGERKIDIIGASSLDSHVVCSSFNVG